MIEPLSSPRRVRLFLKDVEWMHRHHYEVSATTRAALSLWIETTREVQRVNRWSVEDLDQFHYTARALQDLEVRAGGLQRV